MTTTSETDGFGIAVELAGGRALVRVRGEIDLLTAPGLEAVLAAVVEGQHASVVLDFAEVRFIGAAGLGVVAGAAGGLGSSGRALTVRSPDGFQRRLLAVTRLDEVVRVETVSSAPTAGIVADLVDGTAEGRVDGPIAG